MKHVRLALRIVFLWRGPAGLAQKVTMDCRDITLEHVMDTLGIQTGYVFYYTQPPVDPQRRVTIRANREELANVLGQIFAPTDIDFEIRDRKIYLTRKLSGTESSLRQKYRGVVLDAERQPVVGASVIVRGTTTGVSSDMDGRFEREVQPGA